MKSCRTRGTGLTCGMRSTKAGWRRAGWARGTCCGWRRGCRFTEATSTSPPRRWRRGWGRFVRLKKDFAGAEVLRKQKEAGVERSLVGLFSEGRSIPRHDYSIVAEGENVGRITSGSYSPSLDRNIAMGYVESRWSEEGQRLQIDIRGRPTEAVVTSLPFYKRK